VTPPVDLTAIQARYDALSGLPWTFAPNDRVYGRAFDEDEELLVVTSGPSRETHVCVTLEYVEEGAVAEFIAHAPEDVATLLARVRELGARVVLLEDCLRESVGAVPG
jgi:hypothetical protein